MTIISGISDSAIGIGTVLVFIGINIVYDGGIEGFLKDIRARFKGEATQTEIGKVFYSKTNPDKEVLKSIYQIHDELALEDARRSPTDQQIISQHLARENLKDLGRLASMMGRKGDQR